MVQGQVIMLHTSNLNTREAEAGDHFKFEVSLEYIGSSSQGQTIQQDSVSKIRQISLKIYGTRIK